MKIKALVDVLDIHKGCVYDVVTSDDCSVEVIDSVGDVVTLINHTDFGPFEFEIVED